MFRTRRDGSPPSFTLSLHADPTAADHALLPAPVRLAAQAAVRRSPRSLCISPFVADRYWQFRYCDLSDQVEKVPLVLATGLDLEHVHRLQRLMIVLAENHPALRRVEFHPLHGGDQLL